jgi:hypothetical protein
MSARELEDLGEGRILRSSSEGSGNVLLLFGEGADTKVLKLYRERRGRTKEVLSGFSHRMFEHKRGTRAKVRYRTECLTLDLWEHHGLDVFSRFSMPLPAGYAPPGLWFEYCEGDTVGSLVENPEVDAARKHECLLRVGHATHTRHLLALEHGEPLLVQERGTLNHLFVSGERLISFDFEGGFLAGFPVIEALTQELAGLIRSINRRAGSAELFEELVATFVQGYDDPALLRDIARWGVHHQSYYRRIRRWYDQRRRRSNTKTDGLRFLLSFLPQSTAAAEVD